MTQEEKSAIQAEWLAEEERLEAERIAQCAERVEVTPGWTYDEIINREG